MALSAEQICRAKTIVCRGDRTGRWTGSRHARVCPSTYSILMNRGFVHDAHVVDSADVGMAYLSGKTQFSSKAFDADGFGGHVGAQHLEGYGPAQIFVTGLINLAHSSDADLLDDGVAMGEGEAGRKGKRRRGSILERFVLRVVIRSSRLRFTLWAHVVTERNRLVTA